MGATRDRIAPTLAALALVTIAGATLRAWPVAERALWLDEAFTWRTARSDFAAMATWTHHVEHPPLSFALVRLTTIALGSEREWVLRLPSLAAGIACIPATFWIGRMLHSPRLGLVAAIFAAVDPTAVDQSQQARMYTLLTLLLCATLAVLDRVTSEPASTRRWLGLGLSLALLLWTSTLALAVWAAIGIGVVIAAWRDGSVSRSDLLYGLRISFSVGTLLCAPGIARLIDRLIHGSALDPSSGASLGEALAEATAKWLSLLGPAPLTICLLAAAVAGLALLARRSRTMAAVLALLLVTSFLLVVVIRTDHDFVASQYFIPCGPAIWLGLATLFTAPREARLRIPAAGIAAVIAMMWLATDMGRQRTPGKDYETGEQVRALARTARPGDAIHYMPDYLEVLGDYYGVPAGGESSTSDSSSWLLVGRTPHNIRRLRELDEELSRRFGGSPERARCDRLTREGRAFVVRTAEGRAECRRLQVNFPG